MSAPPITANPSRIQPAPFPAGSDAGDVTIESSRSASSAPTHELSRRARRLSAAMTLAVLTVFGVILWGGYTQG